MITFSLICVSIAVKAANWVFNCPFKGAGI